MRKDVLIRPPVYPVLLFLLGSLHVQEGRYADAVKVMQPLVEGDQTDARARVVLGAAYLALGRCLDAQMELEAAVLFDPDLSEAHYNFAQLLLKMKPPDAQRAMEQYQESLSLGGQADPVFEVELKKALPAEPPRKR